MKKILLTNNSLLVNNEYDEIYTDSPYLVEHYNSAIYLDTLLDKNVNTIIDQIRLKGYEINSKLVDLFFPNYKEQNINIINIKTEFTNVYLNIIKLFKLIKLHSNDEITIKITTDELYNYDSPYALDRFVNVYYWLSNLVKFKNIKLSIDDIKRDDIKEDHFPINNWFLRLVNLDRKILIFNLLKKFNLASDKKNKIYLYKKSNVIREIEPYLFDLGFKLIDMPKINFVYNKKEKKVDPKKLRAFLSQFFEKNFFNEVYVSAIFEMFYKRINFFLQKENYIEKYVKRLDGSIKYILTSTITGFDSYIFAKRLQQNNYKIINVFHGLSTSFRRSEDLDFYECQVPDVSLCFNTSEKNMYRNIVPSSQLYPISVVQEAKKKRLKFLRRFYTNKLLGIKDDINIFYPSNIYPYGSFVR